MSRYINLDKQLVRLYRLNLTCEDIIKEFLLSADVVEVKHGKWMKITDDVFADRFECSECGKLPPIENFEWWLSNYCPTCGAKMENGKAE